MAKSFPPDNLYLCRGFEPIHFECDYAHVSIEGEVPIELSGCLYRIGPNPQFAPRAPYNPLLGDGMIHLFDFHRGGVSYRNRWVRTQQWQRERAAGRALFATSGNPRDADPEVTGLRTDGVANTNLLWHAGRLLALEEGHAPLEIEPASLETLGAWTFQGKLPGNMTAHPKIDPETGELLFFANFPGGELRAAIELYAAERTGDLVWRRRIETPFAALVHDFAITRDFVILFICPVTVSVERARRGGPAIAWEPDKHTWVGVVSRRTDAADPRWYCMPGAAMAWHAMNAFSHDGVIFVDVCQQATAAFPTASGQLPRADELKQFLTRWRLEWPNGAGISVARLSDVVCEYPRIDERRCGRDYRYGYVACDGGPGTEDLFHRGVGRFDHATGCMDVYHAGDGCAVSEPIFVPRDARSQEGEGYLLAVIFDELRNRSHVAIFDAQRISSGPLARAVLDHRVPMGFHGLWRPRASA
jgi:carotenoid cleavage dioxygenase